MTARLNSNYPSAVFVTEKANKQVLRDCSFEHNLSEGKIAAVKKAAFQADKRHSEDLSTTSISRTADAVNTIYCVEQPRIVETNIKARNFSDGFHKVSEQHHASKYILPYSVNQAIASFDRNSSSVDTTELASLGVDTYV